MIRPLFIFPDYMKHISSGMQQRIFLDALDRGVFNPVVLCDKGDIDSSAVQTYGIKTLPVRFAQLVLITLFPNKAFAHDVDDLKVPKFTKEAYKVLVEEDISYVHTCSLPCLSHHIGSRIKKATGKPWVVQFYDPWYGNPERSFFTKYFAKKDKQKEAEIACAADVIIHSNPVIYNTWIDRYGSEIANKMELLPLSVPEFKIKKAELKHKKKVLCDEGKLVISHIGSLSQIRPINTFVDAINHFLESHPEKRNCITLRFVGHVSRENKAIINKAGLDYCTEYIKHQPASELEKFYEQTDILLLMDANVVPNIYFPSKLPDYLTQKLPILCVTSKDSISYQCLHEAGHYCYDYGDDNGVASYLDMAISDYSSITAFDEESYRCFAPEVINAKYQEIISKHIIVKEG